MSVKKPLVLLTVISLLCHEARATSCSQTCHYVSWARDADCSSRRLSHIPTECIDSKVLNLNRNNISVVPSSSFTGFRYLKYLQLLQNMIHTIYPNAFAGAMRLKAVHLLKNNLTTIPAHAFNDTPSLRWLYFSKNRISTIEQGVFQESRNIEVLYLDENQLGSLGESVFQDLSSLKRLLLGRNRLTALPDGIFTDLASLSYLDLSDNQLRMFSFDTFVGLDNLETVKLAGNGLIGVKGGMFSFSHLRQLDISQNNLTTMALRESDLGGLVELKAGGNPWMCDCSLEFLRVTLINLTATHTDMSVCAAPPPMAHASIASLPTLCPPPPSALSSKTFTDSNMVKQSIKYSQVHSTTNPDDVDPELNSSQVIVITPEIITLIAVVVVTCVAILCMITFLCFVLRRHPRSDKRDVISKEKEIKIKIDSDKETIRAI